MSGVHKDYEKSNNAIRFAARKLSNNPDVPKNITDAEIIEAVGFEMGRPLTEPIQHRVCVRAFREAMQ
jgi:hypothetical protein